MAGSGGSWSGGATGTGGSPGWSGTGAAGSRARPGLATSINRQHALRGRPQHGRALYGAYSGTLYQSGAPPTRPPRTSRFSSAGGFADRPFKTSFCSGTTCTISILYDQSPNHNDLTNRRRLYWLPNGGNEANAADGKITVGGHTRPRDLRQQPSAERRLPEQQDQRLATGDQPEAMYMVLDGTASARSAASITATPRPTGRTTATPRWRPSTGAPRRSGRRGGGNGPWVAADLENGMFEGDSTNAPTQHLGHRLGLRHRRCSRAPPGTRSGSRPATPSPARCRPSGTERVRPATAR